MVKKLFCLFTVLSMFTACADQINPRTFKANGPRASEAENKKEDAEKAPDKKEETASAAKPDDNAGVEKAISELKKTVGSFGETEEPATQQNTSEPTVSPISSSSYMDVWNYSDDAGLEFYDQEKNRWIYPKEKSHYVANGLLDLLPKKLEGLGYTPKSGRKELVSITSDSEVRTILQDALSKSKVLFEKIKIINDFVVNYLKDNAVRNSRTLLFEALCLSSKIKDVECKTITGKTRVFSYTNEWINGDWSAVKISGKWYLIDTANLWLFADPKAFVHSHVPNTENMAFELLKNKMTEKAVSNLPNPSPLFFSLGLKLAKASTVVKSLGEYFLKIINPEHRQLDLYGIKEDGNRTLIPSKTIGDVEIFRISDGFGSLELNAWTNKCRKRGDKVICPTILLYKSS